MFCAPPARDQGPLEPAGASPPSGRPSSPYLTQGLGGTPTSRRCTWPSSPKAERGKGFTVGAGASFPLTDVLKQEGNNFKSTATLARWTGCGLRGQSALWTEPSLTSRPRTTLTGCTCGMSSIWDDRKKPMTRYGRRWIRRYSHLHCLSVLAVATDDDVSFYNSNSNDGANHEVLAGLGRHSQGELPDPPAPDPRGRCPGWSRTAGDELLARVDTSISSTRTRPW